MASTFSVSRPKISDNLSGMAAQLENVVSSRYGARIPGAVHLIRSVKDDCTLLGDVGFSLYIGFERAIKHNHDFVVGVFMRRMGCRAGPEHGLMHLQSESGMFRSKKNASPFFGLPVQIGALIRTIDLGI